MLTTGFHGAVTGITSLSSFKSQALCRHETTVHDILAKRPIHHSGAETEKTKGLCHPESNNYIELL